MAIPGDNDPPTNVKVVPKGGFQPDNDDAIIEWVSVSNNKYIRRRDEDLVEFVELLTKAKGIIDEVIVGFGMYDNPKHKNLTILIDQQIDQINEYKRVKT